MTANPTSGIPDSVTFPSAAGSAQRYGGVFVWGGLALGFAVASIANPYLLVGCALFLVPTVEHVRRARNPSLELTVSRDSITLRRRLGSVVLERSQAEPLLLRRRGGRGPQPLILVAKARGGASSTKIDLSPFGEVRTIVDTLRSYGWIVELPGKLRSWGDSELKSLS